MKKILLLYCFISVQIKGVPEILYSTKELKEVLLPIYENKPSEYFLKINKQDPVAISLKFIESSSVLKALMQDEEFSKSIILSIEVPNDIRMDSINKFNNLLVDCSILESLTLQNLLEIIDLAFYLNLENFIFNKIVDRFLELFNVLSFEDQIKFIDQITFKGVLKYLINKYLLKYRCVELFQYKLIGYTVYKILEGHSDFISIIALSSDFIVTGSNDNMVKVWDLYTGKLIYTLNEHLNCINSIAISSDQKFIVTGSSDMTAKVWDMQTGQVIKTLIGHTGPINSLVIDRDGKYIVTGSFDNTAKVWNMSSGRLIQTLEGHIDSICSVSISKDNNYIITCATNGVIKIWDLYTYNLRKTLHNGCYSSNLLLLTENRDLIVTINNKGDALICNTRLKKIFQVLNHDSYINAIAISSNNEFIMTGGMDKVVKIWKLRGLIKLRKRPLEILKYLNMQPIKTI